MNEAVNSSGGISNLSIFLLILIIIIIGVITKIVIPNRTENEEIVKEEEIVTYNDLEKELENKFSKLGIEWNREDGINSVYYSMLKKLINKILDNLDKDIEDIIGEFEREECKKVYSLDINNKFNKLQEPVNFAIYFQEEKIEAPTLVDKIQKLAKRYCEKAVERVKEKLEVALNYNNKDSIKDILEEMKRNL